jgi:hypothetical protein
MNPMQTSRLVRQATFAWHQGLAARAVAIGVSAALVAAAGVAALQLRHASLRERVLASRLARAERDTSIAPPSHEPPPDVVQRLPAAPSVDQLMFVLQRLAGEQGVRVASLQSDDHPATPTELGRLGVAVTLRAPYPAIVRVLQGLLDHYPGATLRRLELARSQPTGTTSPMPGASAPAVEVEAHVALDLWSRAVGVVPVPSTPREAPEADPASAGRAASTASVAAKAGS